MATWDEKTFALVVSTVGEDMIQPKTYLFKFAPMPENGNETYYYKIVPDPGNPAGPPTNPFEGCSFFPQTGKKLTKYIPESQRINEENYKTKDEYKAALVELGKLITIEKINEDPHGYERLVGFVKTKLDPTTTVDNPVMFYQVEDVLASAGTLLLIARIKRTGANPNGTIILTG